MKYCIILGTRPEIIKFSSIIRYLNNNNKDFIIIHTNQHYSAKLDSIFFSELKLPKAKYNLNIGSGSHGEQTGKMLYQIEKVLIEEKPDIVFVQGDTNTVFSGALAASKLNIKIGHIEAGLRSYDRSMPEEINRIMTDHISNYLFVPTLKSRKTLLNEGINEEKIICTGNTIVDAVFQNLKLASERFVILDKFGIKKDSYILLTAHRAENTDDIIKLKGIFKGAHLVALETRYPVICPIHPRTRKMLDLYNIEIPDNIFVIEPLGFLDFLYLQKNAAVVLTDSGGIQEECCILNVRCVTLRENTERPETIEVGGNILAGTNAEKILSCTKEILKIENNWKNPFGDGKSYMHILNSIN